MTFSSQTRPKIIFIVVLLALKGIYDNSIFLNRIVQKKPYYLTRLYNDGDGDGGDNDEQHTKRDEDEISEADEVTTRTTTPTDDEEESDEIGSSTMHVSVNTDESNVEGTGKTYAGGDSCGFQNSETWLTSTTRLSNIDEDLMTDELIESLILGISPLDTDNGSRDVLQQSLCLDDSNFVNWKPTKTKFKDDAMNDAFSKDRVMKDVAFRLMYLAFHEHQYGPARTEAITRYRNNSSCNAGNDSLRTYNVPRFDFECPGAKYIVVNVPTVGIGASVRTGLMDPMFLGLVSGRVVLFMNSLPAGRTEGLKYKWPLASCPRGDMQCSFMPSSPCVITEEDLERAPIINEDEKTEFRKNGKIGPEYDDEKVIIFPTYAKTYDSVPSGLRTAFVDIISSFYDRRETRQHSGQVWELDENMLQKVKEFILDEKSDWWIPYQAATFYVFRPNMKMRKSVEKAIEAILPEDFDFQSTFGFPIRASDKCGGETECLTFDENMQLAQDFVEMRAKQLQGEGKDASFDRIMLTSESNEIIQSRLNYTQSESFPFSFIVNENDTGQGTGLPVDWDAEDADNIMLSSFISLKMQLHTESLVVNECSNFHKVLFDLVLHGCGANNYIEALNQNDNPKYHLLCRWQHRHR